LTHFRSRPGSKSATRILKHPFPDSTAFSAIVRALLVRNPLGCTSYYAQRRNFPPVMPVRERYTAKFVYLDTNGKQVGTSSEVYDSLEGYETGSASMITNMSNIAAHRGKVKHFREADLFNQSRRAGHPTPGMTPRVSQCWRRDPRRVWAQVPGPISHRCAHPSFPSLPSF
jgi:hypothetical protein